MALGRGKNCLRPGQHIETGGIAPVVRQGPRDIDDRVASKHEIDQAAGRFHRRRGRILQQIVKSGQPVFKMLARHRSRASVVGDGVQGLARQGQGVTNAICPLGPGDRTIDHVARRIGQGDQMAR